MFGYVSVYELLLVINPLVFLLLGLIAGLFISNWKKHKIISPVYFVGLTFLLMLVFQGLTYDHFLFVYAIVYALIGVLGIVLSMLTKKLVAKIFMKSA